MSKMGTILNGGALTRLTEDLQPGEITDEMREAQSPRWIAPIVTWLVSAESRDVTGRVFEASADWIAVAEGWHRGPTGASVDDDGAVDGAIRNLLAQARPNADLDGQDRT